MENNEEKDVANEFKEIAELDFHKINKKITKVGYVDGLADGRQSVFQAGFDVGYCDGLRTGFELEKFKAFYENLKHQKSASIDQELENEFLNYSALQIEDAKNKKHFQYPNHRNETIKQISEFQHKYIDEMVDTFNKEMPLTSKLLTKL